MSDQRPDRGTGVSCSAPAKARGDSFLGIRQAAGKGRWCGVNWGIEEGSDLREAMEGQSVGATGGSEKKNYKT